MKKKISMKHASYYLNIKSLKTLYIYCDTINIIKNNEINKKQKYNQLLNLVIYKSNMQIAKTNLLWANTFLLGHNPPTILPATH